MAIQAIENAKILRKYGKQLGREELAKKVLKIAQEIIDDGSYKGAIRGAGKMRAITDCCKFDDYWTEKFELGWNEVLTEAQNFDREQWSKSNLKFNG